MPGSTLPTVCAGLWQWEEDGKLEKGGLGLECIFLWGIVCFSSMDIADGDRRNKQSFSVFFRDGAAHRGGAVTDVCQCSVSIYLFGKQMHY